MSLKIYLIRTKYASTSLKKAVIDGLCLGSDVV